MSFESNVPRGMTVIGDDNAHKYQALVADPRFPYSGGYVERDYESFGLGYYAPTFTGKRYPRSDWDELIQLQEKNQSSPLHVHLANKVPILDQNGYGYCWCFGTVGAVMNRYAAQGIPVPHLSATSTAFQGKRGRNQGGWAGEAIKYIREFGIATVETWPEHDFSWGPSKREEQKLDAKRHGIVDFEELPSNDFEAAMSCLLDPTDPCPVTLGLMWWGHLIYGARAVKIGHGSYGIEIINSWKRTWENEGRAVLKESKATAHEYIRVKRVMPRAA